MGSAILQMGCMIQCPHGGMGSVVTANTTTKAGGAFALLATDTFTIAGCPFVIGVVPHPCVAIQWSAPAQKVTVNGTPVLLESSVGICQGPDQAPQGTALVSAVQTQVQAT
jgi:hypothetical protein